MSPPGFMTIDVAHPPMSSDDAEAELEKVLRAGRPGGGPRIVKVVHGYGSGGKGGVLKTTVRNWAWRRRDRITLVVPGEDYSPLAGELAGLIRETGISMGDLGPSDPGFTLLVLP